MSQKIKSNICSIHGPIGSFAKCPRCIAEDSNVGIINALDLQIKAIEKLYRFECEAHAKTMDQRHELMHALEIVGFPSHEDLDLCGCSVCNSIRSQMVEAGYLESRDVE